jgi:hypothetical protein
MPRKSKSKASSAKSAKPAKSAKSLSSTLKTLSPIPGSPGGPGGVGGPISSSVKSTTLLFGTILGFIGLIINVYAIIWIYKLETIDCKCSNTWMRMYIKFFLHVIIPVMVIQMLVNIYLYSNNMSPNDITSDMFSLYKMIVGFVNILGFLNIVISIIFINKLKEMNCECSEDIQREVYFIYNIVLASIIGVFVLMAFMAIPLVLLQSK